MGQEETVANRTIIKQKYHKAILIVAASVVFLLITSVVIYLFVINRESNAAKQSLGSIDNKSSTIIKQHNQVQSAVDSANQLYGQGKKNDAIAAYNSIINSSSNTSDQKKYALLNLSITYANDNDYNDALTCALKAEKISKDESTEQQIAYIYEKLGNKASAIIYYKEAKKISDASEFNFDSSNYQKKIEELSK